MIEQMSYKLWLKRYNVEPEMVTCEECNGDGVKECKTCFNVKDCEDCSGAGEFDVTRKEYDRIFNLEHELVKKLEARKENTKP